LDKRITVVNLALQSAVCFQPNAHEIIKGGVSIKLLSHVLVKIVENFSIEFVACFAINNLFQLNFGYPGIHIIAKLLELLNNDVLFFVVRKISLHLFLAS
jgi:hypothetical protein